MAKLPPAVAQAISKWTLNFELDDLVAAYYGALGALKHMEAEVEPLVRQQLGLGPADDFPEADPDDPEDPIAHIYEHATETEARARRGSHLVRKTFLIALFHLWERSRKPRPTHEKEDRGRTNRLLDDLECVANCAKHPRGPSARTAFRRRPDLFPKAVKEAQASERTLLISEDTFSKFLEAVRATASK